MDTQSLILFTLGCIMANMIVRYLIDGRLEEDVILQNIYLFIVVLSFTTSNILKGIT